MYLSLHVRHRHSYQNLMITRELSVDFFFLKNREISNFMKIRSVGVELLRATRQA